MDLKSTAAEYFSKLNPIASRIYADLQETKGAYEDLWNHLSQDEQDQILTESIIKPEVSVKYSSPDVTISKEYAVKVVVDDHCSYRDEHSGPFSFRTRSQRNLTVFQGEPLKTKVRENKVKPKPKTIPKNTEVPTSRSLYAQEIVLEDIDVEDGVKSNTSTLPKTGLDFLDNW
ncbi:uncharacterized protein C1orf198 homolog [Anthonomus grandis grandis]|uniref:uncharacterized protein C1orf198 homolog n=1 Tax=Anthonomus grandis grandis TaxID=2921223 RepID=UPI002165D40A|nr:uncharacterized protein C1orf198 homolog [Anthonomus grandis grandis]